MKNLDSEALDKAAAKLFAASETKPIANWKRLTERAKDYWRKLASIVADALSTKPNKGEAEPKRSDADAVRDIMAHADDDLTEYGKSQLLLPDKPNEGEGVKVKPLEWKHYDETNVSSEEWIAHGVLGFNTVVSKGGNVWRYGTRLYSTIEEAKAAAQADYASRIRSALITETDNG